MLFLSHRKSKNPTLWLSGFFLFVMPIISNTDVAIGQTNTAKKCILFGKVASSKGNVAVYNTCQYSVNVQICLYYKNQNAKRRYNCLRNRSAIAKIGARKGKLIWYPRFDGIVDSAFNACRHPRKPVNKIKEGKVHGKCQ